MLIFEGTDNELGEEAGFPNISVLQGISQSVPFSCSVVHSKDL